MLGSVFAKSLRDRWTSVALAGAGIGLMLLFAMAVYAQVDTSFYYDLPAPLLEAMGISTAVGGIGGIAYGAMYNFVGAVAMAGVAISVGASAIAGEERDGTLGILLSAPRSRTRVAVEKMGALVTLVAGGGLLLWLAALLAPLVLGVDTAGVRIGALVLHLTANALLWGMAALAVGAWTGRREAALGGAAGAMVLSWLGSSILPLLDGAADAARLLPWHYFSSSQPEVNGVDPGHLAVQLGLSGALSAVALVGLGRRDLREASTGISLLDRLRANPRTRRVADRVAGSARVSGITAKTVSDHQGMLTAVAGVVFSLSLLVVPMYALLPASFGEIFATFPEALRAAIGGVDMSTPTGWVQGELLGSVLPIAAITLFASVGARALAGEEERGTMQVLLSAPVSRARVVRDKAVAMLVHGLVLATATFAGITIGALVGGLDLSPAGILAASVLGTLLGLVHGAAALLLGAATGRVRLAVYGAAGLGVAGYVVASFLPLAPGLAPWARLSPFHWFLSSDPLVNGMAWDHAAVLVAVTAALLAAAVPLLDRRDLRG